MTTKIAVDPVVESLRRVRENLVKRGWVQGIGETADGRVCLGRAITRGNMSGFGIAAAQRALGFSGTPELVQWNDTKGRTKEEVFALIDRAIASLLGVPVL